MKNVALLTGLVLVTLSAFGGEGVVRRSRRPVPGRYIVALQTDADSDAVAAKVRTFHGARVGQTLGRFKGLVIEASDADAVKLSRDPRVAFIEEDGIVTAAALTPTWGLDRIDQRALPLDDSYTSCGTGVGVTAYVVDTGIDAHSEFGSRLSTGFTAINDGRGTRDCNGHGTKVAGILGGTTYGVASAATLVPVRVLGCDGSGSVSNILAGLDWIEKQGRKPAVVNMSLGGSISSSLDRHVAELVSDGFTVVVAAGNDGGDACWSSPARTPQAITVGATNTLDARASFSNYGTCVDLFAPGANIPSSSISGLLGSLISTATGTMNGTSASAPYVSGVAALWLERFPTATPSSIAATLRSRATADVVSLAGQGSPNFLLYSGLATLAEGFPEDQLIDDPGFEVENGKPFWASDICAVIKPAGCGGDIDMLSAHTGAAHAALGGSAKSFHLTSEAMTIPSTAKSVDLGLYLLVSTKGKKPTAADRLAIEILDASGALLETVKTFSNLDASTAWTEHHFDMTRYRGKTIRVSFTGTQGNGPTTWFQLDDITLTARR